MKGKYTKHNNNWGFVSPEDRNTPQVLFLPVIVT